jgi:hypothetical protein
MIISRSVIPKTSSWIEGVHFQDADKWCQEWSQPHHMNATCRGFTECLDDV